MAYKVMVCYGTQSSVWRDELKGFFYVRLRWVLTGNELEPKIWISTDTNIFYWERLESHIFNLVQITATDYIKILGYTYTTLD